MSPTCAICREDVCVGPAGVDFRAPNHYPSASTRLCTLACCQCTKYVWQRCSFAGLNGMVPVPPFLSARGITVPNCFQFTIIYWLLFFLYHLFGSEGSVEAPPCFPANFLPIFQPLSHLPSAEASALSHNLSPVSRGHKFRNLTNVQRIAIVGQSQRIFSSFS